MTPTGSSGTPSGRSGTWRMFWRKIWEKNMSSLSSMDNALSTQTTNTSEKPFLQCYLQQISPKVQDVSLWPLQPKTKTRGQWNKVSGILSYPDFHPNFIQARKLGFLGRFEHWGGHNEIFCDEIHRWSGERSSLELPRWQIITGLLEWSSSFNYCPPSLRNRERCHGGVRA